MWPNPQFPVGLVPFTEEILNGDFHFFEVIVRLFGRAVRERTYFDNLQKSEEMHLQKPWHFSKI